MEIRHLTYNDDQIIINFLNKLSPTIPSVLGYHYPFYRDMLLKAGIGRDFYLGLFEDNELTAYLPGFIKDSAIGSVYSSLPYFGPNAGVLTTGTTNPQKSHELLLGFLVKELKKKHNLLLASIYTPFGFNNYAYYEDTIKPVLVIDKFTQYLKTSDVQWDSKLKYDIKKATKAGVRISNELNEQNINQFIDIYFENCREFGIPPKPKDAINFLIAEGIKTGQVTLDLALYNGEVIGGLMMVWSPKTASYYIPCSKTDMRTLQSNSLLIDHVVEVARRKGIDYFNWESSPSMESGVYKFKDKWGSLNSSYKIYIIDINGLETVKNLDKESIMTHFPYFFVYPFDKLQKREPNIS